MMSFKDTTTTKQRKNVPLFIYIVLLVASTIIVSNIGGAFFYVLFYAFLFYPVVSFLCILENIFCIRIYQDIDGRLLYKGKEEKYEIVIENVGIIPTGEIRLIYGDTTSFRDDYTKEKMLLLPREKKRIKTGITCKYAGSYEAGISHMILQDIFGIVKLKIKLSTALRVHVLPAVTNVANAEMSRLLAEPMYRRSFFKLDKTEEHPGNDMRKYVPGDPVKSIHWKNYARTGEAFVRLPENADSDMVRLALVVDKEGENKDKEAKAEKVIRRDYFLEYLVSVAWYFAEQKKPLMVYFHNGGVKTFLVDGPDSFYIFYTESINRLGSEMTEEMESELLTEAHGEEICLALREEDGKLCRM